MTTSLINDDDAAKVWPGPTLGLVAMAFAAGCGNAGSGSASAVSTAPPAASSTAQGATTTTAEVAGSGAAVTATASASGSAAAAPSKCAEGMVEATSPSGPLCMGKTEVTVAQYRQCVDDGKCHFQKPANAQCNWHDAAKGNHPMNCVGRTQAEEYCKVQGGRLPSVDEWEHASRDGETKPYAWGSKDPQKEPDDSLWCWSGKQKRTGTCEVGIFPAGATKSGLLDMSGNVAEWATGGDVEEKSKTCGRAWDATEGWKAMEKCPGGYFAEAQTPVLGFRCVAPVK